MFTGSARGKISALSAVVFLALVSFIHAAKDVGLASNDRITALSAKISSSLAAHPDKPLTLYSRSHYRLHSTDYKAQATAIDTSKFNNIISIDPMGAVAHVEAQVTMEALVRATMRYGLIPKVVPAYRKITIGGAVMGSATGTSSFRNGQFNDICSQFTVVLGNGTVVECTKEHNSELFYSLSGSYGSLGVLVRAVVELEPCSSHVQVTYQPCPSIEKAIPTIQELAGVNAWGSEEAPTIPHYLDAIHFPNQSESVVMYASPINPSEVQDALTSLPLFSCSSPYSLFFLEHVNDILHLLHSSSADRYTELMPTVDYLFRYDRNAFWIGQPEGLSWRKHLLPLSSLFYLFAARNILIRVFFRWLFSSSIIFSLLRFSTPDILSERLVVTNPYLPIEEAPGLAHFISTSTPIQSPLYLCPVMGSPSRQPFAPHGHLHTFFMEVGVYGRVEDGRAQEYMKNIESYVRSRHGRKGLCAQNFYNRHEFWSGYPLYDKAEYDYLRDKYFARRAFPSIDSKVCAIEEGEGGGSERHGVFRRYLDSRRRKFSGMLL